MKRDRAAGRAALNDLFRAGSPPEPPLDGRYAGQLLALDLAPGLTELARWISARWMPWQGKTFAAAAGRGDNVFTRDSLPLAHLYWPLYRGYRDDGPATYRAFAFRTWLGPGLADPDLQVLKIDYGLPENPRLSVRRVLDEVVQVAEGLYLGQAHLKWWWGRWQVVAYFSLERRDRAPGPGRALAEKDASPTQPQGWARCPSPCPRLQAGVQWSYRGSVARGLVPRRGLADAAWQPLGPTTDRSLTVAALMGGRGAG